MRVTVRHNILANYVGTAWAALIQTAFVPLYIRFLGIESYGLIGVYTSLQILFSILDLGLTPTLNREMARYRAGSQSILESRSLLRTLEVIYLALAGTIFLTLLASSSWLAHHWLHSATLAPAAVSRSLTLMGILIALRWVTGLYRGAIMGLQHQVWLSVENSCFSTLRGAGVIGALYVFPTLSCFFIYQAGITAIEAAVLCAKSWRLLPAPQPANFDVLHLTRIWRFSVGIALITVLSLILMQSDKILLSKLLGLKVFAYYALASTVASGLSTLVVPISNVAFPRLTELVYLGDQNALRLAYHRFAQILSLMLIPGAITLALFSHSILLLWTHDVALTAAASPLVTLLVIGSMLNGLMYVPYNLQLAHGWTRFTAVINSVLIAVFVPALYFGVSTYGPIAAGYAWIGLNLCYVVVVPPLMHRHLLPGAHWHWYKVDVLIPASVALAIGIMARLVLPSATTPHPMLILLSIGLTYGAMLIGATMACPLGRTIVMQMGTRIMANH